MVEFFFTGYGVPVENMPVLMQRLANLFPIYHYMFIFRSILLKGAGIPAFWEHIVIALGLGVVINSLTLFFLTRQKWE
jgi:ABC-2 type transport system permease protein